MSVGNSSKLDDFRNSIIENTHKIQVIHKPDADYYFLGKDVQYDDLNDELKKYITSPQLFNHAQMNDCRNDDEFRCFTNFTSFNGIFNDSSIITQPFSSSLQSTT